MTHPAHHVQPPASPTMEVRIIRRMLNSEACLWLADYNTIVVHAGLSPEGERDAIWRTLAQIGLVPCAPNLALTA